MIWKKKLSWYTLSVDQKEACSVQSFEGLVQTHSVVYTHLLPAIKIIRLNLW